MNSMFSYPAFIIVLTTLWSWLSVALGSSNTHLKWQKSSQIVADTLKHERVFATDSDTVITDRPPPKFGRGSDLSSGDVFRAIWNVPNSCDDFGIELPLREFGIEFNRNHQWTYGNVISIFYSQHLGLYPYYKTVGNKTIPVNGGLPQLANITQHLEKATADILAAIPDPNFDGMGVLDWEAWRPQWEINPLSVYYQESIAHVRQMHSEWDNVTVESIAKLEWMEGAKLYMESTLKLVKSLRPNATWGYYAYPHCYDGYLTENLSCPAVAQTINNNLMWLFNQSTAHYPSYYLRPGTPNHKAFVKNKILEAFRVRKRSSDLHTPVLSYMRFNYSHTNLYYNLEDLNNTILQSAEMGTHGVIIWGADPDDDSVEACTQLRSYIMDALGPVVMMSKNGAEACSDRVCSGKGRCVGDILECGSAGGGGGHNGIHDDGKGSDILCTCRCFRGWKGNNCGVPV